MLHLQMTEGSPIRTIRTGQNPARQAELVRQREIRHTELVPLYVVWASDVSDDAAKAALQGVVDAVEASGQNRGVHAYGSQSWASGDYSSADWYVEEAFRRQELRRDVGYGQQVDAGQFSRLFAHEPWQENPHWEVLVTNHDLTSRDSNSKNTDQFLNFVYGSTDPGFPSSVQSIRRIVEDVAGDKDFRNEMIRMLLRHEVGHMFGLVRRTHGRDGLRDNHCENTCSMKQTLNLRELAENTVAVENSGRHFCGDCMAELSKSKDRYRSHNPQV